MIIALSGYGGSGKDSVADVLVEEYGFKRYAWADTLRLAAAALNPIVAVAPDGEIFRYNDVIELVGYNEAKFMFPEVRVLLQRLGTEVGRNLIGDNVWVDATIARIERECSLSDNIVITDTRFPNEAEAVTGSFTSGYVVRVNRPGVGPAGDHPSETSLDDYDFDYTIENIGTLSDLAAAVSSLYNFVESDIRGCTPQDVLL